MFGFSGFSSFLFMSKWSFCWTKRSWKDLWNLNWEAASETFICLCRTKKIPEIEMSPQLIDNCNLLVKFAPTSSEEIGWKSLFKMPLNIVAGCRNRKRYHCMIKCHLSKHKPIYIILLPFRLQHRNFPFFILFLTHSFFLNQYLGNVWWSVTEMPF